MLLPECRENEGLVPPERQTCTKFYAECGDFLEKKGHEHVIVDCDTHSFENPEPICPARSLVPTTVDRIATFPPVLTTKEAITTHPLFPTTKRTTSTHQFVPTEKEATTTHHFFPTTKTTTTHPFVPKTKEAPATHPFIPTTKRSTTHPFVPTIATTMSVERG